MSDVEVFLTGQLVVGGLGQVQDLSRGVRADLHLRQQQTQLTVVGVTANNKSSR